MMDDTNPLTPPAPAVTEAPADQKPETPQAPQAPAAAPAIVSEATIKFRSCRWRADPEAGEFCTHRDVLPFAGKEGFNAESWCPECEYYKLRRTPKKRERVDYSY
jgi:hypothetical protein